MVVFFSSCFTVGAVPAQAKRKQTRAIAERIKPNLIVFILLPSFLFGLFFNLLYQFAIEFMLTGHQFPKSLRAKIRKIDDHIFCILFKDGIIHPLLKSIMKFFDHIGWSAF